MDRADFINKLRDARRLLDRGWMQGNYSELRHGGHCYCLVGALLAVGIWETRFQVVDTNGKKSPLPARTLIRWNDARGRTVGEVLACIDNSIAALEREAA